MAAVARPSADTTAEARHWAVEREDYDACLAVVRSQLRDGEVLLHVRTDAPS